MRLTLNPFAVFRQTTAEEHAARRQAQAKELAEYHRQKASEMKDTATWATCQAAHHGMMAEMYKERAAEREVRSIVKAAS
jgi:hypothetical protein